MAAIYGHKWASSYGESAILGDELTEISKVWSAGLKAVTADKFSKGLDLCVSSGKPWPPTLPEFREMCLGQQINEFGLDYVPEYHRQQPERRRENLLSSDERDAKRRKMSDNLKALRNAVSKHRPTLIICDDETKSFVADEKEARNEV